MESEVQKLDDMLDELEQHYSLAIYDLQDPSRMKRLFGDVYKRQAYTVRWLFVRLYPPRKMLIIYGKYSPDDLIKKVNSRRDKYNICGAESIAIGYEELTKRIPDYEAVVLCDLPAHTRNKILKFCFEKSIRIYVTPKLSDIIISGSESIHLFDTPVSYTHLGEEKREF